MKKPANIPFSPRMELIQTICRHTGRDTLPPLWEEAITVHEDYKELNAYIESRTALVDPKNPAPFLSWVKPTCDERQLYINLYTFCLLTRGSQRENKELLNHIIGLCEETQDANLLYDMYERLSENAKVVFRNKLDSEWWPCEKANEEDEDVDNDDVNTAGSQCGCSLCDPVD